MRDDRIPMTARASLLAVVLLLGSAHAAPQSIVVANHASGETVRYPVLLLRGAVPAADHAEIVVRNLDSKVTSHEMSAHVWRGHFKALAELVPGTNRLRIACGDLHAAMSVRYDPPTTGNVVRFVYIVGADGDATYQTERPDDAQDFRGKLDTAAKLFQTFCAESLADAGLGGRSVRLELDAEGRVDVHVVRAPKTGDEYRAYTDDQRLYQDLAPVVAKELPPSSAKNVAVMSFTRFDPVTRRALAHTALGGGDFGLFGSAGLFTWPSRLQDVEAAFSDTHPVDGSRTHDDSVGRSTYWGLASTTLGAVFHETGHTFGLPHSVDPLDVMTRGFDKLNRVFTVVEPPARGTRDEVAFADGDVAHWGPISGPRLAFHPFFEEDAPKGAGGAPPSVHFDSAHRKIVVDAPNGLRALGIDSHEPTGDTLSRETIVPPDPGSKRAEFDVPDLRRRAGGHAFDLVAFDARRNRVVFGCAEFLDPAEFVRSWRFAAAARPWTDVSKMPAWTDDELVMIVKSAAGPPQTSPAPFVDLISRFGPAGHRVAFAFATLRMDRAVNLRMLTGSDDTIRVRIDGRVVLEKLVFRGAAPDADATDVDLAAGDHALSVECGNGDGGWGFYVRFVDADGRVWAPDAAGRLAPR